MIILFSAFLAQASPEQASIYLRQGNCYEAIQAYPDPERIIISCHRKMSPANEAADQADMMLDDVSPPQKICHPISLRSSTIGWRYLQAQILAEELLQEADLKEHAQLLKQSSISNEQYIAARDALRPLLQGKRIKSGYLPSSSKSILQRFGGY